jgi:alcohol dehydrogenase class IV
MMRARLNAGDIVTPFVQLPKLFFDFGAIQALPTELRALGSERPLLITDAGLVACGTFDRAHTTLRDQDFHVFDQTPQNPTSEGVEQAYLAFRTGQCDAIVGIGDGPVIDTAKMVAVLAGQGGSVSDFFGRPGGLPFSKIARVIEILATQVAPVVRRATAAP